MKGYRLGLGFDVHRFAKKKKDLILGGVKIPGARGLLAVSDGDVILHAVADALCGACLLGDIGDYFSPLAKKSKDIDSKKIINFILSKVKKRYKVANIDITVIADKPPLSRHKKNIIKSLKKVLAIPNVNLKVKSKEGLNILGGKNSIACIAVALVKKC